MSELTTETAVAVESDAQVDETPTEAAGDDALVEQELLVEDVSIDGMCGVY